MPPYRRSIASCGQARLRQIAAGIPNARLRIIERAGHNPQSERPAETLAAVADFLALRQARRGATGVVALVGSPLPARTQQ